MANRRCMRVFTAQWVMMMVVGFAAGACSGSDESSVDPVNADDVSSDTPNSDTSNEMNGGPTEVTPEAAPKIQPKISIHFDDPAAVPSEESGASLSFGARLGKASSAKGQHGPVNISGTYTPSDVTTLKIDVKETSSGNLWFTNLDLVKDTVSGDWTGQLPFLPQSLDLTFIAHAYDTNGTEIYTGSSQAQLTTAFTAINIQVAPANNNSTNDLLSIKQIGVPADFVSGKGGQVSFYISAKLGEKIKYSITSSLPGSGSFVPANGTVTLVGTTVTFFAHYVAPIVNDPGSFTQQITITNEDGNSVTTDFQTSVIPASEVIGVENTTVNVLFNPTINALNGYRAPGTGEVTWTATVSDDKSTGLSYKWSFAPGAIFTPALSFFDDAVNPATLENYTEAVHGKLTLKVTDADNGVTTLHYNVAPKMFPDNTGGTVGSGLSSISAGGSHTCALLPGGAVRCWGAASSGQLGYGNTFPVGTGVLPYKEPHQAGDIPKLGKAQQVVTGVSHTCALLDNGLVRCWGNNLVGQLGYKLASNQNVGDGEAIDAFGYVSLGGTAAKLAAGGDHTCALMNTGKVRCWGRGTDGQLGYGGTSNVGDNELPWQVGDVLIDPLHQVVDIVAGLSHTCALLDNGKVRCWGRGAEGQLGYANTNIIGDGEDPAFAGDVDVGGNVVQIAAGDLHTCALLDTGNVRCWGHNNAGQLGYGNRNTFGNNTNIGDNETPASKGDVNVGGAKVIQVATGGTHTCALLEDGQIKCWGLQTSGQLGYGDTAQHDAPPLTATVDLNGTSAFYITTGKNHTCALLATGAAWCWGAGASGQLGYGNTNPIGDNEPPSAPTAGAIKVLAP